MMTDDSGRLLVLGGHGRSGTREDRAGRAAHRRLRQQRRLVRRHVRRPGDGAAGDVCREQVTSNALCRCRISRLGDRRLSALRAADPRHGHHGRRAARPVRARVRHRYRHSTACSARSTTRSRSTSAIDGALRHWKAGPARLEPGISSPGSTATSGRSSSGRTSSASSATSSASRTSRTTRSSAALSIRTSSRACRSNTPTRQTAAAATERSARARDRARWRREARAPRRSGVQHDEHGRMHDRIHTGRCGASCSTCCGCAGEENEFKLEDQVSSRLHNLPLMPLLCGDNPLTNTAPSKFLRLTDYQLFILQAMGGRPFHQRDRRRLAADPPYNRRSCPIRRRRRRPGGSSIAACCRMCSAARSARAAKSSWIMRNPSIYWEPYRIKADRSVSDFLRDAPPRSNQTRRHRSRTTPSTSRTR